MNLKLEELRRRLLEPVATPPAQSTSVYKRSSADLVVVSHKLNGAAEAKATSPAVEPADAGVYRPPVAPKMSDGKVKVLAAATPSGIREAALRYAENAPLETSAGENSMESNSQYQVAQAVSKVFEQVKAFEARFVELTRTFEPVEALAQSAAKSFTPLRAFQEQLAQLSRSFEPMRAFQLQLADLAQSFAPMKGLQHQLGLLSDAFEININQLVRALEPAKEFQAQLIKLARAFEPATELADDFALLANTFRGENDAPANGVAPVSAPVDLQH
ncbi:MAG TPA: hypothetical protein VHS07_07030 [Candidatus Binataceae bacterium]|jgi:hypothetical protein|nr:hypothetical protein [Candidatus Binataceae bacterium]